MKKYKKSAIIKSYICQYVHAQLPFHKKSKQSLAHFLRGLEYPALHSSGGIACDIAFLLQGRFLTLLKFSHALVLKPSASKLLYLVFFLCRNNRLLPV